MDLDKEKVVGEMQTGVLRTLNLLVELLKVNNIPANIAISSFFYYMSLSYKNSNIGAEEFKIDLTQAIDYYVEKWDGEI